MTKTSTVALGDLTPDPRNARKHSPRNVGLIVDALHEVGAARSIVIDEDGVILAGNATAEAAGEAGITKVQVVEADGQTIVAVRRRGLTAEQKAKLALYDNRAAELADGWYAGVLKELAAEIDLSQLFTADELAELTGETAKGGLTDPDAVPDERQTDIVRGDLFALGEHRLLCGDSTSAEDVARVMDGGKAGLCFTSPPYGQQRDYTKAIADWDALMRGVFGNLPMADDGQVLVNLGMIHRDGEWMPYWDGWIAWMREQGWRRFGWYVLDQGWGLPGDWNGRLAPSHEFVFHFNQETVRPSKHVDSKMGGETAKGKRGLRGKDGTVSGFSHAHGPDASYTYPDHKIPDSVIRVHRQCGGVGHPAPFSVAFATFVLQTWERDPFEPFSGSGTTLIACEQLGRKCYAIEIEPKYVQVAIDRWEQFTGRKAVKL